MKTGIEQYLRSFWVWLLWVPLGLIAGIIFSAMERGRPLGSIAGSMMFGIFIPWSLAEGFFRGIGVDSNPIGILIFFGVLLYFLINLKKMPKKQLLFFSTLAILASLGIIRGCGQMAGKAW